MANPDILINENTLFFSKASYGCFKIISKHSFEFIDT